MAHIGSGNWYRIGVKETTEDNLPLDIRPLARQGLLKPGGTFTSRWRRGQCERGWIQGIVFVKLVLLQYRVCRRGEEWKEIKQTVWLTWTPCHYGGQRPWWRCPGCDRRVAVLYGAGKWFL
jgi:hypothetical protein